jgi:hypothetical protein
MLLLLLLLLLLVLPPPTMSLTWFHYNRMIPAFTNTTKNRFKT